MKIYDKRIYKISECIRVVIIVIVCFMIGYVCGILAGDKSEELKKDYYNVINKIENKIDILDIVISECIYIDDDDKAYKKAVKKDKLCLLNQKRALQELLEGRE